MSKSHPPVGDYLFCVKRWGFDGIKSEEFLQSAVARVSDGSELDSDTADMIVNFARLYGDDWLDAQAYVDGSAAEAILETLESSLDSGFQNVSTRKQHENSDRATFQVRSLQQHMDRKLPGLREQLQRYIAQGKKGPANMTQGKINKLDAKCKTQIERIKLREKINASKNFVCAGLIRIDP